MECVCVRGLRRVSLLTYVTVLHLDTNSTLFRVLQCISISTAALTKTYLERESKSKAEVVVLL
jgi:hypothetical protein